MKVKHLFLGMLALAAITSCSKNDDNEAAVVDNGTKAVSLSLNYVTARGIEAPENGGAPTLSDVQIEFFSTKDGSGPASKAVTLTADQIKALNAAGAKLVTVTAPTTANSMRMVANNGATTEMSKSIVDYQGKKILTAIPYEGIGVIVPAAVGKDYAATVTLNPIAARVEVFGNIVPKAPTKWTVEIVGVYANNFLTTLGLPSLFALEGAAGVVTGPVLKGMADLKDKSDAVAWGNAFKETGSTNCVAYQLFPGSYGLTLQVKVARTTTVSPIPAGTLKFLVIKSFSSEGDLAPIANLTAGKIYKLDLTKSGLEKLFTDTEDPTTPTPDGAKSVAVSVNVTSWTVQNVIPNL